MDGPGEPTDDRWNGRPYVAPVGRVGRRAPLSPWVIVATVALVTAILKPWGASGGPQPAGATADPQASGSSPGAQSSAEATGPTEADRSLLSVCHNTDAWLVATVEASRGQTLRILRVLSPGRPAEPGDPAVPRVVFGSERVMDLGWCAPVVGDGRSSGVTMVEARMIVDGRAQAVPLVDDMPAGGSEFGALYPPPQVAALTGPKGRPRPPQEPQIATWTTGVYVFTLHEAEGGVHSFAVDLEILPPRATPPPAPPTTRPTVGSESTGSPATTAPDPAPAITRPEDDEMASLCVGADAWLVASEEQVAGRAIRTLRAIDPVVAIRPDDPAIPWVRIPADRLSALGWCGPESGIARMADPTSVQAWALTRTGIRTLTLARLRPSGADSSLGGLYRPAPPRPATGPTAAWPAGRYVFRVLSGDGRTVTFGVEVTPTIPGAQVP